MPIRPRRDLLVIPEHLKVDQIDGPVKMVHQTGRLLLTQAPKRAAALATTYQRIQLRPHEIQDKPLGITPRRLSSCCISDLGISR